MNIYLSSQKNVKVHFIGIGGINMSALAKHLNLQGFLVSGSDVCSNNTAKLKCLGIKIFNNHSQENVKGANLVVYTSAISSDNPELVYAINNNVPIIKRSELLGQIMALHKTSIAISGCHGKTTATDMIADMLICANLNPTVFLGGEDKNFGNYLCGSGDIVVAEACEYQKNFLDLKPSIAVVLNIDNDHLDTYKSIKETASAFYEFSKNSISILNADDKTALNIATEKSISFAKDGTANFIAKNLSYNGKGYSFTVYFCGRRLGRINLKIAGEHNVYNALSCVAVGQLLKLPFNIIKNSLENFCGVGRRNEFIGSAFNLDFYCDYAHHPKEILTMLKTYEKEDKEFITVFQPHTYSRTRLLINEFIDCFSACSPLIIYKTYPAREKYDKSGSARTLFSRLDNLAKVNGKKVYYANSKKQLESLLNWLSEHTKKAVFLGAGDIYEIAKEIVNKQR